MAPYVRPHFDESSTWINELTRLSSSTTPQVIHRPIANACVSVCARTQHFHTRACAHTPACMHTCTRTHTCRQAMHSAMASMPRASRAYKGPTSIGRTITIGCDAWLRPLLHPHPPSTAPSTSSLPMAPSDGSVRWLPSDGSDCESLLVDSPISYLPQSQGSLCHVLNTCPRTSPPHTCTHMSTHMFYTQPILGFALRNIDVFIESIEAPGPSPSPNPRPPEHLSRPATCSGPLSLPAHASIRACVQACACACMHMCARLPACTFRHYRTSKLPRRKNDIAFWLFFWRSHLDTHTGSF